MMSYENPITKLTHAQQERLLHLLKESTAISELTTKILLSGYSSKSSIIEDSSSNGELLEDKIINMVCAVNRLAEHNDIEFSFTEAEGLCGRVWDIIKYQFKFQ